MGSFQEAVEHAKDTFERAQKEEQSKTDPAILVGPPETVVKYSVLQGVVKTAFPVISGAGAVALIAVLDYVLNTDYLSGKLSPIAVIGLMAAARFIQNYLKQAKIQAQIAQVQGQGKE